MNRYLILILSILIILSINVVSANDANQTLVSDSAQEILNDENPGNFTELSDYLNGKSGEVELNKSYKYAEGDSVENSGIPISKSITLNGNGNTIDASNSVRIFSVTHDNVIFKNITFINAKWHGNGGAVYLNTYNVSFIDCTFKSNTANQGGAIYSSGTVFRVENSVFEDNEALIEMDDNYYNGGGAIYITGEKSSIINSQFINNHATLAVGGAISVHGNYVNISSSAFKENSARKGGAVALHASYAHIELCNFTKNTVDYILDKYDDDGPFGAGIYNVGDHTEILKSRFVENEVLGSTHNNHLGAGVYSYGKFTKISDSVFESNKAAFGAGVYSHNSNAIVENCNFTDNLAYDTGAGVTVKDKASVINCNFKNNHAQTHGGALYIDEADLTADAHVTNCNFTDNRADGNSGAIHLRTDKSKVFITNCKFQNNVASDYAGAITSNGNSNIDGCEFYGNNATIASAIRLADRKKSDNKLYILNSVFGKNRANSSSLVISIDNKESYSPSDVNVKITLKGHDNIANAIWNDKSYKYVFVSNITYEIYKNGQLTQMITPAGYINPANGVENSDNGNKIWQDVRENAQSLNIRIICDETGENILDDNGEVLPVYQNILMAQNTADLTDIDGSVVKSLKSLKAGNYTVYASHERDEYYTEIDQMDTFAVYDWDISKVTEDSEVYIGQNVTYIVKIKNNGNLTLNDIQVKELIPEGFELISSSPEWTLDGDTFYFQGTLDSWSTAILLLTFNATKIGKFNNTITVSSDKTAPKNTSSNPTKVKPYPSKVKGKDVKVHYGTEISVPVVSENATEITYEIIDKTGKVVKKGSLKPGENITGLKLPPGEYTLKLTAITDENHTQSFNTSKIIVDPLNSPDNSTDDDPVENETQKNPENTTDSTEKSKTLEAGLSMHETGNPIFGLFLVLIALGLAKLRRFKL